MQTVDYLHKYLSMPPALRFWWPLLFRGKCRCWTVRDRPVTAERAEAIEKVICSSVR